MSEELLNGTVVKLKSGGPLMTIIYRYYSSRGGLYYECCWYVKGFLQKADFPPEALKRRIK